MQNSQQRVGGTSHAPTQLNNGETCLNLSVSTQPPLPPPNTTVRPYTVQMQKEIRTCTLPVNVTLSIDTYICTPVGTQCCTVMPNIFTHTLLLINTNIENSYSNIKHAIGRYRKVFIFKANKGKHLFNSGFHLCTFT